MAYKAIPIDLGFDGYREEEISYGRERIEFVEITIGSSISISNTLP